jgi:hypothetical protein
MTSPDQRPSSGQVEPGWENDPEVAEAYADEAGVDPTPAQINEYLQLEGQPPLGGEADRDDTAVRDRADDEGT